MTGVHALQNMVSGMSLGNFCSSTSLLICKACIEGKPYRTTFSHRWGKVSRKIFGDTHSNVFGHMKDVVLIINSVSNVSDLEIRPNRKNKTHVMVGGDESSKSPSFVLVNIVEERGRQVEDVLVIFQ